MSTDRPRIVRDTRTDDALLVDRPDADGSVRRGDDACTEPEPLGGGGIVWGRSRLFPTIPEANGSRH